MYEVGQEVVLMSAPGRFRIIEIDGDFLLLENSMGVRRKVKSRAVRIVSPASQNGNSNG